MLKHQLRVAALVFAALTFTAVEAGAAPLPRIDVPHPSEAALVGFGHGGGGFRHFGGGGFRHFGGGGFRHFGGFGFRHFGFAPHRAFVGHFHRPVFFHRFHRRAFVRRAFFIGTPLYASYAYGGGCAWL